MASAPHAYLVPKGENLPAGSEKDDMELKDVFPVNLDYSFPEAFAQSVSRGTGVQVGWLMNGSTWVCSACASICCVLCSSVFGDGEERLGANVFYANVFSVRASFTLFSACNLNVVPRVCVCFSNKVCG